MTVAGLHGADAPGVHSPWLTDLEPFHVYAGQRVRLVPPGICENPCCSRAFAASRDWQAYCSETCRRMDEREFARVGTRAAPALLAWQAGRYASRGTAAGELSNTGRRFYSSLAAEWLRDRRARAAERGL